ncbi:hypothetical protein D3C75_836670 [compost metagenome]
MGCKGELLTIRGTCNVPDRLRKQLEWSVQDLREKAFVTYGVDINPTVSFGVNGMTAAYALFDSKVLDFNLQLGLQNREVFETEIVGHEFIHLLADEVFEHQHHGKEWKELMREFGLKPSTSYELKGVVQRREKVYIYKCDCTTRYFTREQHKNNSRHIQMCPDCRGTAKCINDRESHLRGLQPGTQAHKASQLLIAYAELEVPPKHAMLLLQDNLKISPATARVYYYKYRPTK